jgi:hypothetical protein
MSGQMAVASDAEVLAYDSAAEMMLSIAELCVEYEPGAPEAAGAVAFLRWYLGKSHSERMGDAAGEMAGASGRTLQ